jgi:hypothetical protein
MKARSRLRLTHSCTGDCRTEICIYCRIYYLVQEVSRCVFKKANKIIEQYRIKTILHRGSGYTLGDNPHFPSQNNKARRPRGHKQKVETHRQRRRPPQSTSCLRVVLCSRRDLGSLNNAHLGDPSQRRLHLADSPQLVGRVAGDADIVRALQHQLQITDLEYLRPAFLGVAACGVQHTVDKRVCEVQNRLCMLV